MGGDADRRRIIGRGQGMRCGAVRVRSRGGLTGSSGGHRAPPAHQRTQARRHASAPTPAVSPPPHAAWPGRVRLAFLEAAAQLARKDSCRTTPGWARLAPGPARVACSDKEPHLLRLARFRPAAALPVPAGRPARSQPAVAIPVPSHPCQPARSRPDAATTHPLPPPPSLQALSVLYWPAAANRCVGVTRALQHAAARVGRREEWGGVVGELPLPPPLCCHCATALQRTANQRSRPSTEPCHSPSAQPPINGAVPQPFNAAAHQRSRATALQRSRPSTEPCHSPSTQPTSDQPFNKADLRSPPNLQRPPTTWPFPA